jgi:hypothetical protein
MTPLKTLGELRASIADLPDSTPIVQQPNLAYLAPAGLYAIRLSPDTTHWETRVSFWSASHIIDNNPSR